MTRRDFQLIAEVFADHNPDNFASAAHYKVALVYTMADRLAATNPRFDHGRFTTACEPKVVSVK